MHMHEWFKVIAGMENDFKKKYNITIENQLSYSETVIKDTDSSSYYFRLNVTTSFFYLAISDFLTSIKYRHTIKDASYGSYEFHIYPPATHTREDDFTQEDMDSFIEYIKNNLKLYYYQAPQSPSLRDFTVISNQACSSLSLTVEEEQPLQFNLEL